MCAELTLLFLNIHTKGLVGFYGISTIVGYLMPNPVFTNIKWFVNSFGKDTFKRDWAHLLYTACTQLNGFNYCYVILTIQLNSHLLTQLNYCYGDLPTR